MSNYQDTDAAKSYFDTKAFHLRLKKRYRAEKRFQRYGIIAIALAFVFLAFLLFSVIGQGYSAFSQTVIHLRVKYDQSVLLPGSALTKPVEQEDLIFADYQELIRQALHQMIPGVESRSDKRMLYSLASRGAGSILKKQIMQDPKLLNQSITIDIPAASNVDMYIKKKITRSIPENQRKLKDKQLDWIDALQQKGVIKRQFNWSFFSNSNSREPELAGIWGSIMGSLFTIVVCMVIALPLGVLTAIYLEEFAPKNFFTDIIEININNLAAVPSIVFGLLGLALYLDIMHLPRSASLVGGMTLALMVLPTIVITARNSLRAIPPSIRLGALALGASKIQTTFHHVVPLAMPGIMTGTILSISRALGETAPLIMIGMVAFVIDVPSSFLEPATTMPVQIFTWSDSAEIGFAEKTSAAIMVLLGILICLNAMAAYIRKKYEKKW